MSLAIYIGLLGGLLVTIAFIPQVLKTWKTKKTGDISLAMFAIILLGNISWITYGVMIKDIPVILTNSGIFVLASTIVYFKVKYK